MVVVRSHQVVEVLGGLGEVLGRSRGGPEGLGEVLKKSRGEPGVVPRNSRGGLEEVLWKSCREFVEILGGLEEVLRESCSGLGEVLRDAVETC